jgi:hypothetical protein
MGETATRRQGLAAWQTAALAAGGATALIAAANWLIARATRTTASPLAGDHGSYAWSHGTVAYTSH